MTKTFPLHQLHQQLLTWWQESGRVLPWRQKLPDQSALPALSQEAVSTLQVREQAFQEYMAGHLRRDPYRVVVAELMLQQTQVDRVLPKFLGWMQQWPQIQDLAKAELSEVLVFWKGLGYNRRARFLWLLSKNIVEANQGIWPQTEEELLKLPGLGKYTARAVLSFAFGEQVAVVDTNVKRVLRRILEGKEAAALPVPTEKEWFAQADAVLPPQQADPWNQLIMDLGALICTAKAPKCEKCPVQDLCQAQQLALSHGFSTYREYLASVPVEKKKVKKQLRFEETDRFFRGRIMDVLREGKTSPEKLWETLHQEYGLEDFSRFNTLLESLSREGMIKQSKTMISLG